MRAFRGGAALVLPLVVALAACADTPTGPDDGQGIEAQLTEVAQISGSLTTAARAGGGQHLQGLFRKAVLQVRDTEGVEAARALIAPIRDAARAAREIRRSGDRDAFHAAMEAVHLAQATVIVDVLGSAVVEEALAVAEARLAALQARVDAAAAGGRDVTAIQARVDAAAVELAEARALAATDPAAALVKALFFGPHAYGGTGGMGGWRGG
ncbi:MAG: hypothetical protein WEB88_13380 [Gemmatimonadota bacterium]